MKCGTCETESEGVKVKQLDVNSDITLGFAICPQCSEKILMIRSNYFKSVDIYTVTDLFKELK